MSSAQPLPANAPFVAAVDGRVLGFLKLKEACPHPAAGPGTPWQTQKLDVDPGPLRSGLGQRLMEVGEAWMRVRGAGSTWLVVHKGNAPAIRFNGTLGLRQPGVEFHDFEDLRVEFQLMAKNL